DHDSPHHTRVSATRAVENVHAVRNGKRVPFDFLDGFVIEGVSRTDRGQIFGHPTFIVTSRINRRQKRKTGPAAKPNEIAPNAIEPAFAPSTLAAAYVRRPSHDAARTSKPKSIPPSSAQPQNDSAGWAHDVTRW